MNKQTTGRRRQKYWQRFCQQKLALISLILLVIVVVIALFVPIIANDKPILLRYQQQYLTPIFYDYPETRFGGEFETTANYQDPAVMALIERQGTVLMPPIRYGEQTLVLDAAMPHPAAPSSKHWLGTDAAGRDVVARILYALRTALLFGFMLAIVGGVIGVLIGALMGYFAGVVDLLGQRLLEIWIGLPQLFVMLAFASVFEPSTFVLFLLLLAFGWLSFVPLVRLHFLSMRKMPYVLVAQNLGVPTRMIMRRHILPSALLLVLSQLPFAIAANIAALTTLDFLGFGLPVGSASLGELLAQGKNHLDRPHLVLSGFAVLSVLLLLLIFVGEGLRNALDRDR